MRGGSYLNIGFIFTLSLIVMVLSLFGIFSIFLEKSSDSLMENVSITIFFEPDLLENESLAIHEKISSLDIVQSVAYTSRDDALLQYRKELGEDIVALLGENPLPSSTTVVIKPKYLEQEKMSIQLTKLRAMEGVLDVQYIENVANFYYQRLSRVKAVLWFLLTLLIGLVIYLLSSIVSLRLSQDKKAINTQFLVGAKPSFILRPYLLRSLFWACLSYLFGIVISLGVAYLLVNIMKQHGFLLYTDVIEFLKSNWQAYVLQAVLLLLGTTVVIYLSTYIVVSRRIKKVTYNFH